MSEEMTFGVRLQLRRERAGKSRAVLGGLVGRSEEWVKAVETGRLLMPRLPMLLRLADVLGIENLAELTGEQSVPAASVTKASHEATPAVVEAMNRTVLTPLDNPSVAALTAKVDLTWRVWNGSYTERTATATVLPELLIEARRTVRSLDGPQRRRALAELARVYHLAQLFFAYQPGEQLVWLAADRAMTAAQDADDPAAIAAAAWYYSHVYRYAAQFDAAEGVAADAAAMLDPGGSDEQRARWGELELAQALAHAKAGRAGQAWRHHDQAVEAARSLGDGYAHPWLPFGQASVDAYGVTIETDLFRAGEAIRRADRFDVATLPSRTRQAFSLLEGARAHSLRREHVAVVHLIGKAVRASHDTVRHSIFARVALLDLMDRRGNVREDARELALAVGLLG